MDEHTRIGVRMGLGVFITTFVGWGLVEPHIDDPRWKLAVECATNAAAITTVIVNAPCIGKVSQAGLDRALGTILGGFLGWAVFSLICRAMHSSSSKPECWDAEGRVAVLLGFCGFVIAWASVYIMWQLAHLENTPRLLMLTYVLVAYGAHSVEGSMLVMMSRIIGIMAGTFISLLLSVVVMPRAATQDCLLHIKRALAGTKELGDSAWQQGLFVLSAAGSDPAQNKPYEPGTPRQQTALSRRMAGEPSKQDLTASSSRLAASGCPPGMVKQAWRLAVDLRCEKALMNVYTELDQAKQIEPLTENEYYVGTINGRMIFLPSSSCLPCHGRWRLPLDVVDNVDLSIRWVARLLWTLHLAFQEGFAPTSARTLARHYPPTLLQDLSSGCQGALEDLVEAFPCSMFTIPSHNLERFKCAVTSLLRISEGNRRRLHEMLRSVKSNLSGNMAQHRAGSLLTASWDTRENAGPRESVLQTDRTIGEALSSGREASGGHRDALDSEEDAFHTPTALSRQASLASTAGRSSGSASNDGEQGALSEARSAAQAFAKALEGGDGLKEHRLGGDEGDKGVSLEDRSAAQAFAVALEGDNSLKEPLLGGHAAESDIGDLEAAEQGKAGRQPPDKEEDDKGAVEISAGNDHRDPSVQRLGRSLPAEDLLDYNSTGRVSLLDRDSPEESPIPASWPPPQGNSKDVSTSAFQSPPTEVETAAAVEPMDAEDILVFADTAEGQCAERSLLRDCRTFTTM